MVFGLKGPKTPNKVWLMGGHREPPVTVQGGETQVDPEIRSVCRALVCSCAS